ncbi:UPF0715 family protein [Bacillus sp. NPDC077027]|uniref:UPF0715 family protein n=1 Tax=Bacillus sp. NPDC077027 TaxID=3390548 RepID=UPI003D029044
MFAKYNLNKHILKIMLTLAISSILLGLFACISISSFANLSLGFILLYTPVFFVFYFIFAVPIQFFLNRKPKKFSFLYLTTYLIVSALVIFLVLNAPRSYVSVSTVLMSSLIFWACDSLFYQTRN